MNKWEKRRSTQDTCNRFENETTKLYIYINIYMMSNILHNKTVVWMLVSYIVLRPNPHQQQKMSLDKTRKKCSLFFIVSFVLYPHLHTHHLYCQYLFSSFCIFVNSKLHQLSRYSVHTNHISIPQFRKKIISALYIHFNRTVRKYMFVLKIEEEDRNDKKK